MTTYFIGTTFPDSFEWSVDEKELIKNIHQQIDAAFPTGNNLFINTTWFGPQFDNTEWIKYQSAIATQKFDRLFLLAAADPVFLNAEKIRCMQNDTQSELYLLGHFDTSYYFNFHSYVLPKYFVDYNHQQLQMKEPKYLYVNYNRKPRDHRSALVNQLLQRDLIKLGIVTLGKKNNIYSQNVIPVCHLSLNETPESVIGNWGMDMGFGIPHDIHSLGRLDIWQNHFLNIVGETEFLPWDPMFISEKTWKPILGLRPFIINGQTKIYKYLRDQGFCTFNHYWPNIDVETQDDTKVTSCIIEVIDYLGTQSRDQLIAMYNSMLPDLIHNRKRFFEFSKEQHYKIDNLFK